MALSSARGQDLSGLVKSRQRNYYGTESSDKEDSEKLVKLPHFGICRTSCFYLILSRCSYFHSMSFSGRSDTNRYISLCSSEEQSAWKARKRRWRLRKNRNIYVRSVERDSGLIGAIYGVCEEIFEKHLTVLMFTMLDIYSHPPVDVQSVCLDVFESVENKNPP